MIDYLKMIFPVTFLVLIMLILYIGYRFFVLNTGNNSYLTTPYVGKGVTKEQHWIKCDVTLNGYCFGWKEDIPEDKKITEVDE